MIKEYLGTDLKTSGFFMGCVIGSTVVATVLFWLIFGFDVWKQDVRTASDLMVAAAVGQMPAAANPAGQFVCPQHGAVGLPHYDAAGTPRCPLSGQVMQFYSVGPNNPALAVGVGNRPW